MKAIVYTQYGSPDVLRLAELEKPVPSAHEIVIRVRATSVGFGDLLARNFKATSPRTFSMPMPLWLLSRLAIGLRKPRNPVLGSEFAGEIEAVGEAVTRFKVGDPVFGYCGASFGANAEYLRMPEKGVLAIKPANMTFEEAATVPYGALTALNLLQKAGIGRGQKVLVNGASGGIGSFMVQLAKHYGAHVTGVCSTPRMALVAALGADKVIDYTKEDFTRNGETYDLIFDVLGKSSFARCKRSLKPNGRYLPVSFKLRQVAAMLWTSLRGGKRVICALAPEKADDLILVKGLIEAGQIRAIIDRCYPLEQTADAHRYIEQGHKKGSVVIIVAPLSPA